MTVRAEPVAVPGGAAVTPGPGRVRVVSRDWPGAPWVAVPCLAVGLPLLVWSVATARAVEGGGAIVFCGFGALSAWLALAKRRDVVVERTADAVRVRGREGCGPFARDLDVAFPADSAPDVVPFAVPDGAPDLPDRGGDLVLRGGGSRILLARRAGPGWREELDAAAAAVRAVTG